MAEDIFGTSVLLNFGVAGSDFLITTVTGQTWVSPVTTITATIVDDARAEEAALEQITVTVAKLIPYIGFNLIAHAPNGLFYGTLNVHVMGK